MQMRTNKMQPIAYNQICHISNENQFKFLNVNLLAVSGHFQVQEQ